jgi:hypothetical protein
MYRLTVRRDGDAQFQKEFGGNPFLAPGLIRPCHLGDHVLQRPRNPRTARAPGLPPPEQAKSLPVPAHEGLRSHDDEELSPVDQPREQHERDSAGIVQAPRFGFPLDVER